MMRLDAVVLLFGDLGREELTGWVVRRWVRPEPDAGDYLFREVDIARVRLIHDLSRAMAVAEDTVPLVLSLLDQVYELRGALAAVSRALEAQPGDIRRAVLNAVGRNDLPATDAR